MRSQSGRDLHAPAGRIPEVTPSSEEDEMSRRLRVIAVGAMTLLASGAIASTARADGLPVPLDQSQIGITDSAGDIRYHAVEAGDGTVLIRQRSDGLIFRSRFIDGRWGIPAVAYDGTSSGLSEDGDTLALIQPRDEFPRADTPLLIFDAVRLRITDRITLDGDFSFDAISPDGETIYLIHYLDRRDPTQYEVRSYDVEAARLDPKPIVDPNDEGDEMYGSPMTRATSPDGRWAYTLYDGVHHPFIHALDTERGAAVCIDLDPGAVPPRRLFRMNLDPSPDGSTLTVTDPKEGPVAIVDTKSFEVSEPRAEPPAADGSSDDSGGAPWLLIALGALGAAGAALAVVRWRRRPPDVGSDDLEELVRVEPEADVQQKERDWHRVS
jgi:hypothetical protein